MALKSSGSSSAAMPVEPTTSQNRTVRWRRSGSECRDATVGAGMLACGLDLCWWAAIALRIRLRSPSGIPRCSRSASVRSNRTSVSMAFSTKTCTYCARPSPLSHPGMLFIAVLVRSLSSMASQAASVPPDGRPASECVVPSRRRKKIASTRVLTPLGEASLMCFAPTPAMPRLPPVTCVRLIFCARAVWIATAPKSATALTVVTLPPNGRSQPQEVVRCQSEFPAVGPLGTSGQTLIQRLANPRTLILS